MPTHRFPTDTSFHIGYSYVLGSSSNNYATNSMVVPLTNAEKVGWHKNLIQIEYQPSNHFSFGGHFTFQRTILDQGGLSGSRGRWSLGDQSIFAEYRFVDGPGYSLGLSGLIKFPGYQNDTGAEAGVSQAALLPGDAQTDFGGMLSSEFWPTTTLRVQSDFGYLFRTQSFANQLIYQGSVGFVIPRMDLSLRLLGYHSVGNGPASGSSLAAELSEVRSYFGNSYFAYAGSPSLMMLSPRVEFWVAPEYAITSTYSRTLMGTEAAKGYQLEFGLVYRFTERKQRVRRNFTEVGIETDQSTGVFDGEVQEQQRKREQGSKNDSARPRQDFDFEPLYYESAEPSAE